MRWLSGYEGDDPGRECDQQQHWERYQFAERMVLLGVHEEARVRDISVSIGTSRGELYDARDSSVPIGHSLSDARLLYTRLG